LTAVWAKARAIHRTRPCFAGVDSPFFDQDNSLEVLRVVPIRHRAGKRAEDVLRAKANHRFKVDVLLRCPWSKGRQGEIWKNQKKHQFGRLPEKRVSGRVGQS